MKTGFIGCGNMAGAILSGCLQKGFLKPEDVIVCEKDSERLSYIINKWGVRGASDTMELLNFADAALLGVKPGALPALLAEIGVKAARKDVLFISIAAGQSLTRIEELLGKNMPVVRVMPNLNARICEGVAAICANPLVTEDGKRFVIDMFQAVGIAFELPEEQFSVFTAIAGCSPAFTYMYIDALARAAVRLGMNKKQASEIAAAAVIGSAKTLSRSEEHAWDLIDQVCSPGGTTIEGVSALQAGGFESVVARAVNACVEKDKRL
ncbi:MAG: pyrroline-5-carboxylate reductase [Clostridiales bacterium]|jgi:pyrroline-5-carboxylate reductase|nr:pyrroline-5-carboxylate reductase [Clostridiales bacterium]